MYRVIYTNLSHHGVKGQKWGIRNGPPYPIPKSNNINTIKNRTKSLKPNSSHVTIIGHQSTPKKGEPNSVVDSITEDGTLDKRSFYDENGNLSSEIHPNGHPHGDTKPHAHDYEWNDDGTLKLRTTRDISDEERKENSDIV